MRKLIVCLILATSACTTQPTRTAVTPVVNGPSFGASAYFASYPDHLFEAAEAVCTGPGQDIVRKGENQLSCESLPTPETAAGLILQFDGTVEELPKHVITFSGQQDSTGYLVTTDSYIRIPQRSGDPQRLRFPDPALQENFEELLLRAGGRPL